MEFVYLYIIIFIIIVYRTIADINGRCGSNEDDIFEEMKEYKNKYGNRVKRYLQIKTQSDENNFDALIEEAIKKKDIKTPSEILQSYHISDYTFISAEKREIFNLKNGRKIF